MSVEFDLPLASLIQRNTLDFLGEESDDYFFFSNFLTRKISFSKNIQDRYDIMNKDGEYCTFQEWKRIIYPKDIPALQECLHLLKTGARTEFHLDFRLINRDNDVIWVSSHAKVTYDSHGQALWMFGRLSETALVGKSDSHPGTASMEGLKKEISALLNDGVEGFLLLVGVDDLKSINLKSGREFGDQVIQKVAESLENATRGTRRVYRTIGDCFSVVLPHTDAAAVKELFGLTQHQLAGQCTLSGGCVPLQEYRIPDAETLYQYAEASLDSAKRHGKKNLTFFSAEDYEKRIAALELTEDLDNSISNGFQGFSLQYQPQVFSQSYQLYGAEALLRYTSPRCGAVSPVEFIPLLEQNQKICQVGLWVLDTALAQCKEFRKTIPDFHISVNMSYTQLCQSDILSNVLLSLQRSGLPGSALTIEITESMQLLDYPHINDIFLQWKSHGIEISVDDFGTGYSSLGRLKELEIDEIKIDRCFVSNIQHSAYNYRLLSNMMELADSCQIRVCCEGVETRDELAALEELHPSLLQGFLFSKPCTPEELTALYLDPAAPSYMSRIKDEAIYHQQQHSHIIPNTPDWPESELANAIMDAENDVFYISDLETYELYYLNPAGQRLMGIRDYRGRKCYKVLQGRDTPCPFCTTSLLKENDFYVWERHNEYCGRHFLLKDKIISYRGKKVRLEVALDITKHEVISERTKEQLNFAQKIEGYVRALTGNTNYGDAVNSVLASVGDFYQADQAYLFEPDPNCSGCWNNTFEWCANGVSPQSSNLQNLPPMAVNRWLEQFALDHTIYIYNLDVLKKENYLEWEILHAQGISRLIAVPLQDGEHTIGFIGVDNPRYSIHDDSQIRVLSHFLRSRIHQDRNELRYQKLLEYNYHDIFDTLDLGLWVIRINREENHYEMLANDTMLRILGISGVPTPEECYQFWYSKINDGYYYYVNHTIESMIQTRKPIQLEYTWMHPQRGEVLVRCAGIRAPDQDGSICLRGYHRIIDDLERPSSVPDICVRDVFEYSEISKSIFFHTDRLLVAGSQIHESNFPQCWIDSEIIHPHFVEQFRSAFSGGQGKEGAECQEMLLKSKSGTYEWFKLTTQRLDQEKRGREAAIAVLEPIGSERVMELEYMRMRKFYHTLLSETIAYAEVELPSGELKSVGGIWRIYEHECQSTSRRFLDILAESLSSALPDADVTLLKQCQQADTWTDCFRQGNVSQRYCYRRPVGNELHWVELTVYFLLEDVTRNAYVLIYLKDINAEKERELTQAEAASRDPLTHIYNRTAFEQKLAQSLSDPSQDSHGVLMLLDIDNFKLINDNYGHLEGDRALKHVAESLTSAFRQEDVIGRLGGDEFLVYIRGNFPRDRLEERLKQLLQKLQNIPDLSLTSSIGLTYISGKRFDYAHYLAQADQALYQSKQNGKNSYSFYEPDQNK